MLEAALEAAVAARSASLAQEAVSEAVDAAGEDGAGPRWAVGLTAAAWEHLVGAAATGNSPDLALRWAADRAAGRPPLWYGARAVLAGRLAPDDGAADPWGLTSAGAEGGAASLLRDAAARGWAEDAGGETEGGGSGRAQPGDEMWPLGPGRGVSGLGAGAPSGGLGLGSARTTALLQCLAREASRRRREGHAGTPGQWEAAGESSDGGSGGEASESDGGAAAAAAPGQLSDADDPFAALGLEMDEGGSLVTHEEAEASRQLSPPGDDETAPRHLAAKGSPVERFLRLTAPAARREGGGAGVGRLDALAWALRDGSRHRLDALASAASAVLEAAADDELEEAGVAAVAAVLAAAGRPSEASRAVEARAAAAGPGAAALFRGAGAGLARAGAVAGVCEWAEELAGQGRAAECAALLEGAMTSAAERRRVDDVSLLLEQARSLAGGGGAVLTLRAAHAVLRAAADSGRAALAAAATTAMRELSLTPTAETVHILRRAKRAAEAAARSVLEEDEEDEEDEEEDEDEDGVGKGGGGGRGASRAAAAALLSDGSSDDNGDATGGRSRGAPAALAAAPPTAGRVGPLFGEAVRRVESPRLAPWDPVAEPGEASLSLAEAVTRAVAEYQAGSKRVRLEGVSKHATGRGPEDEDAEVRAWLEAEAAALASHHEQARWEGALRTLAAGADAALARSRGSRDYAGVPLDDALRASMKACAEAAAAAASGPAGAAASPAPWFVAQSMAASRYALSGLPSVALQELLRCRGMARLPTRAQAVNRLLSDGQLPFPGGASDEEAIAEVVSGARCLAQGGSGIMGGPGGGGDVGDVARAAAREGGGAAAAARSLAAGGWRQWQGAAVTARCVVTGKSVAGARAFAREALATAGWAGMDPRRASKWPPSDLRHRQASAVAMGALHSHAVRRRLSGLQG